MITSTDQLNRTISIPDYPRRIVSAVPSQTEYLYSLGLDEEVAGITKFCIHPEHWFRNKKRVGGTKNLNIDLIRSLSPDLIIANREENTREDIEILSSEFPVWVSDIHTLEDAVYMMLEIGRLVGREQNARSITSEISEKFESLSSKSGAAPSCIYLIWKNPYMAAGGDTFISDILTKAGLNNLLSGKKRYPELSLDEIAAFKPQYLLLSSEPFPFKQADAGEIGLLLPDTKVICVDGEMFSWYGSRLLKSSEYLKQLMRETDRNPKN